MTELSPTMQSRTPVPDGYITVSSVSGLLGLSEDYIYRLSRRGKLPGELVGDFYFKDSAGMTHTVKRIWNKAEIMEVSSSPAKKNQMSATEPPGRRATKPVAPSIPAGFLQDKEAAKLLGVSVNTLVCRAETGQLPRYRWHQYVTPKGNTITIRIWCQNELKKFVPVDGAAKRQVHMPGVLQALLSRLWSRAKGRIVDGDATDLIFGNPAGEKDWQRIEALAKEGCLEWQVDRFDRLEIILNAEWQPDESGSWRCF